MKAAGQRQLDPREGWIRLHKMLDRFEKQLDEEKAFLEAGDIRRLALLQDKRTRLLDEIRRLKRICSEAVLSESDRRSFWEMLKQKERRIRIKILRNVHQANTVRRDAQGRIRSIRVGKRKVLQGYFGHGASEQGYFIDRQIGAHYK